MFFNKKKMGQGAGEMAHQLRALVAGPDNLSLIPSTQTAANNHM